MTAQRSATRRFPKWVGALLALLLVIVLGVLLLAALPVEADPPIPEADWGVGASSVEPSWTGLLREWPEPVAPGDPDPALANLGYRLFFDPVLSGGNTYSCAHCHHPDLGFSGGQRVAVGEGGEALTRNVPTLWNVAYRRLLFWDGRADSLEDQVLVPLTSPLEMSQDPDALLRELAAIDDYAERFAALFQDGITLGNVTAAIAAFERTLISDGAAFDAYAGGDFQALTASQRRGLGLLRSAATRCFECHSPPTFGDQRFTVIGVPDDGYDDRGRGAVDEAGGDFAFLIPTLRNVALSGPYMHNGHFATLEAVIDFYADGAGEGVGFQGAAVDRAVADGFSLTAQEKADLVAFLYALTDETVPERLWDGLDYLDGQGHVLIPTAVPSGLDDRIVEPVANPARQAVAQASAAPQQRPDCQGRRDPDSASIVVMPGQSIQAAVDCAVPGDTIAVEPGVYHERVVIDVSGITLRGRVEEPEQCPVRAEDARWPQGDAAPDWPVLDGDVDGDGAADLSDGVIASGNDFTMEAFVVRNYTGNGVLVEGARGVTLRHLYTEDTGLYGLYPVRSEDVLVECSVATLASDAGIYVGQSRAIVVRHNLAYDSVTGIEIENSVDAEVYGNETWDNTGGILVFLLPNLHSRVSQDIRVHDNYVHHNNRGKDDATPGGIVNLVPIGTGILVMGTDDSQVYDNRLEGNNSFGVALLSLHAAFDEGEVAGVGPLSERVHIYGNAFRDNGANPDPAVTAFGAPGVDLLWDARGYGNLWDQPGASSFPPLLPGSGWPEFARRALFQVWNFVGRNL